MIESKFPNTSESIFSIMSKMANDHDAINLSQGFPNFESDPVLIEMVHKAMVDGHNQYAPMPGDLKLRQAIVHKIEHLYGKKYNEHTEVTITAGATQAIFCALAAILSKGDEVIIFTPAYDCYEPTIQLFGARSVPIQLKPPFFQPDWEEVAEKITERTKMIIINTPHNPSGMLFNEEDMIALQELSEKHDLVVVSDEVYEHIIFDGYAHQSASKFPQLAERCFITASFGKTFHNTGWKMGYCIAPETLMNEFRKVHQYNVFCVNHPVQKALATYLEEPSRYLQLSDFYQQKRDYFLSLLTESRFKIVPAKGTYFQLLDYSRISSERDIEFAERLTKDHKLATIPTSVFNTLDEDFKQIRVCFAKTEETLKRAAELLNTL
ncbi:methionine aminotransferase [Constantimarinum furrinae]|uniref:Methionine aminotransferase n=1 Tax=Constantimarinum furrinae TaxID=2562285 RepID=A0A7G8PSK3_9FLAO|nr:methionine aminotransferase [Constantimarinum furrinae]QNJ97319.1 methionine aminotransferase [Constantimarinum furrinae]